MKEKIYQRLIELTNGKISSGLLKRFATSSLSRNFIRQYCRIYGIDLNEVSREVNSFTSLQDFFTRTLKSGARPIHQDVQKFVSPVDGKIESFGQISHNAVFTVKSKPYSLLDLLGNENVIQKYINGKYIVFYLSPANYHRIHSPFYSTVKRQYVLGQKSYPVNNLGLTYGKKPISHNYRMISEMQFDKKNHFALIKVGAMFVNSIVLTNVSGEWEKGEEIGYFAFGSTVVLLFEKNTVDFTENVKRGYTVKMGEQIANVV